MTGSGRAIFTSTPGAGPATGAAVVGGGALGGGGGDTSLPSTGTTSAGAVSGVGTSLMRGPIRGCGTIQDRNTAAAPLLARSVVHERFWRPGHQGVDRLAVIAFVKQRLQERGLVLAFAAQ